MSQDCPLSVRPFNSHEAIFSPANEETLLSRIDVVKNVLLCPFLIVLIVHIRLVADVNVVLLVLSVKLQINAIL